MDIGYEIRDVMPEGENLLYAFIDEPQAMPVEELNSLLTRAGIDKQKLQDITTILL